MISTVDTNYLTIESSETQTRNGFGDVQLRALKSNLCRRVNNWFSIKRDSLKLSDVASHKSLNDLARGATRHIFDEYFIG